QGEQMFLSALRLLEPGVDEHEVSIFFRDATTGRESYPVGRYVDAVSLGGDRYALDFNRAYNPTCAFSPLYNCPIPPREHVLPVAVRAGPPHPHRASPGASAWHKPRVPSGTDADPCDGCSMLVA